MIGDAPDTAYGAAFARFWQVFTRSPLNIPRLHEAFADLAALAAHEHPDLPWPTTLRMDGQLMPFTVEALLARKHKTYASRASVPDTKVRDLLTRWNGSAVMAVIPHGQGAGFQLRLGQKVSAGPKRMRVQDTGSLGVFCTWQLVKEQQVLYSSDDSDLQTEKSLRALKGQRIRSSELGERGTLRLHWQPDFWLDIQPDRLAIGPDYHLDFGWEAQRFLLYHCFEGDFVAYE